MSIKIRTDGLYFKAGIFLKTVDESAVPTIFIKILPF